MDQIFFTNCEYYDKTDLFKKNFVHSDWVWVDAEKVMKKSLLPLDTRSEKMQICIGNAKIEKQKLAY